VKLTDLERHLKKQGCLLYREGGSHAIWFKPKNRRIASVHRHREIKTRTVRAICKQLEVSEP